MELNATLIVSAVSFIVFIFIMNSIFYEPILKIVQERAMFIDSNLSDASQVREKANAILEDKAKKIKTAHKQAKDTIAQGIDSATKDKTEKIVQAQQNTRDKIETEKSRLLQEEGTAKDVLKSNVYDLAKGITEKILNHPVESIEYNQSLIDEAMNNV